MTFGLDEEGHVKVISPNPTWLNGTPNQQGSCESVAFHAASSTVFCVRPSETQKLIRRFAVAPDGAGTELPTFTVALDLSWSWFRDVDITGDTLLASAFGGGLVTLHVDAQGGLTAPRLAYEGDAYLARGAPGGRVLVLDRDRGLVVLEPDGKRFREGAVQPLDGPLLDLAVEGDRAAVALGSQGAIILRLGPEGITEERRLRPRCVAAAVALHGDALAVACLNGVLVYDTRPDPPRPVGYRRATHLLQDVLFAGDELVVVDWTRISRMAVDLDGALVTPDTPRGSHILDGDPIRFAVRNHGDLPMRVRVAHTFDRSHALAEARVEGGADHTFEIPAAVYDPLIRRIPNRNTPETDFLDVVDLVAWNPDSPIHEGSHTPRTQFTIGGKRAAGDRKLPAAGERITGIGLADEALARADIPEEGQAERWHFYDGFCVGQWAEMVDLAYQVQHGHFPKDRTPIAIEGPRRPFDNDWFRDGFRVRSLRHLNYWEEMGLILDDQGQVAVAANNYLLSDFLLLPDEALEPGADQAIYYGVDARGRVEWVESVYRGLHPLRPE